jgi:4-aminobutyrate aminotransferase-like enzyme
MGRIVRGNLPPRITFPPPGPRSRELARALAAAEAPGSNTLGPAAAPSLVWDEALGANVLDVDGNVYVDLTSGFGAAAVGHRHPRVVAAVVEQTGRLVHGLGDVAAHPSRVALAGRLAALAPVDSPRVHFAVSGADAVEIALKTALAATGRALVVAFEPSYHGSSLGALAVSSRPEFRAVAAAHLHPHVVRLPYAGDLDRVEETLAAAPVAAVIVEPVVGREGVLVPPAGWLAGLAARASAHGALLVVDEILTGLGRTGERFAVDRDGVRPDLVCLGKALGGGLPIAAVVGRAELMEVWRHDGGEALHSTTFLAHPLACAAALAALEVIEGERLVARARRIGDELGPHLAALAARHPDLVVETRGIGALWGLELATADAARRLVAGCRERGVLVLAGGPGGRVVELAPPLVSTDAQLAAALVALGQALAAAEGASGG